MVRDRLAAVLAYLLHPLPITLIAVFVFLRGRLAVFDTVLWSGAVLGALFLPLITVLGIGCHTGRYDSVLLDRRDRHRMYGIAAATMTITTAALLWIDAPHPVLGLSAVIAAYALVAVDINRYMKLSVHAAAVTGVSILIASQQPILLLPGVAAVIGVCWSRVYEEKHTIREVVVGAAIGAVVAAPLLLM